MSSEPDNRFHEEDAEQLIGALAGVVSAHIVTDGTGRMVEIHVLARPDLHPKQVVRNVESALSAGLGVHVDRRIVSVAQIRATNDRATGAQAPAGDPIPMPRPDAGDGDSAPGSSEPAGAGAAGAPARAAESAPGTAEDRLEYIRYESRRDEERCQCQVVLRSARDEVIGTGTGPDTATGRAEAAARAVFDAVGQAQPDLRVELEGAVLSQSRGRSFVIVSAHVVRDRENIALAGAAILSRSPEEAAILAALQASNRWSV